MPDIGSLFGIIRGMVGEIHPHWKHLLFTPDTHLERDLGLNRPARLELRARIESTLGVSLDEATAINATTPLDLLRSVLKQTGLTTQESRKPCETTIQEVAPEAPEASTGTPGKWMYAIYAWSVFVTLGLAVWVLMILTPLEHWRQRVARASARFLFRCTLTQFNVMGRNHLDADRPQVVVANHASYLDGFIMAAALDIPIHFIVKGELSRILPVRLLLQRFGVEFVDRFDTRRGTHAIWRITRKTKNGHTLVFFPEGTFTCFAGMQPFRMGAFVTAARTGVPIVPVAIRGARDILRGDHWLPRRGRIDVTILPPIMPGGDSRQDAKQLRDAARREIGAHCGEPDLVEVAKQAAW